MRKEGKWVIGAAVVAGIGYMAGLLTAPRSGVKTRSKIAKSANKTKTDTEKQLKNLYTELNQAINTAENKIATAKNKTSKELKAAVTSAIKAKEKTKMLLSALHNGDADDPDLKKMVVEAKKAKDNLAKFYKK